MSEEAKKLQEAVKRLKDWQTAMKKAAGKPPEEGPKEEEK